MKKKQDNRQQWEKRRWAGIFIIFMIPMLIDTPLKASAQEGIQIEAGMEEENQQSESKTTQDKINDVNQKLEELQNQKEQAKEQMSSLDEQQQTLSERMDNLNSKLMDLSECMEETQEKISEKQSEVDETNAVLKQARKQEKKQYKDMKQRIRFIYENGDNSYISALTGAESFGDMLNRADYVKKISQYDRTMLEAYNKNTNKVQKVKKKLAQQKKELESLKEQMNDEQKMILQVVDETNVLYEINQKKKDQTQKGIDELNQKIEEQKQYEQKLIAQKAMENSAKLNTYGTIENELASIKAAADTTGIPLGPGFNATDFALMAAIIDCEAEGETYEGKLAVGSVVMNRVFSPKFPNTIAGVIYSPGQFAPVTSGRFAVMLATNGATQECRNAAYEVLNGRITNNFLFFRTIIPGFPATIIDHQMFY